MANRGDSNYRRSGASGISPSGDMDETQVFRPVQSSRRSNPNSSRSRVPQNSSYENGGNSYYDGNGYYDGSYDDSYDNYQDASYGSGYQGYEDYADGYDGYEDDGYADYEDGYEPPHQTLAAKASGMANPDLPSLPPAAAKNAAVLPVSAMTRTMKTMKNRNISPPAAEKKGIRFGIF